jgi:divalent metal cation (Fe/Co/Zn/Cd) transporter
MPVALSRLLTPQRLLMASIVVALITIAMKTFAWLLTDSVGLLSDAMESFVNLASAIFALVMVTIAQRPPDADHPYGHHKAEYFSSGFEGILIIGAALGILWAAGHRLFNPQPVEQLGWGLALSVGSSGLNGLLAWAMFRAAREHRSIALEADAKHLVTDVWTSAGVVVGLVGVMLTGWLWLDALVGMGVALNILREGLASAAAFVSRPDGRGGGAGGAGRNPGASCAIFQHATIRFDHLTTRKAGQRRFVDLHMHMPAELDAGARRRLAHQRRAGADECSARPARHHPAAAQRCGGPL